MTIIYIPKRFAVVKTAAILKISEAYWGMREVDSDISECWKFESKCGFGGSMILDCIEFVYDNETEEYEKVCSLVSMSANISKS